MNNYDYFAKQKRRPVVVGTGLIALDLIYNESTIDGLKVMAGGSCGNVLAALSYSGWASYPIARFKNDAAADALIKDLSQWGVFLNGISTKSDGSTPIIIERIKKNRYGKLTHFFNMRCPECGSFLPRYKPVLAQNVPMLLDDLPTPNVFYLDRVSRSSIELAKNFKEAGALIFFEPPGVRNEKQFIECLNVTDILKYSEDNLQNAQDLVEDSSVYLKIETQGEDGLRFTAGKTNNRSEWRKMKAYSINNVRDTAGAGDWCSAGIIHYLGRKGRDYFYSRTCSDIEEALFLGQVIAAMSCQFDGARGIMYNITKKDFQKNIKDIMEKDCPILTVNGDNDKEQMKEMSCYCPACQKKKITVV